MADDILIPEPMCAAHTLSAPTFKMPDGSWDTHVHVFGPETTYPRVPHPHYTLPEGTLAQLQAMTRQLGIRRFVIVQPSFYGTDNRCMLDALEAAGPTARGVAMVEESVTDEALRAMHESGVRGLRLDLFLRSNWKLEDIQAYITRSIERVQPLGWHVQFYTPGWLVRDLLPFLARLETDFVIDHMGYMLESDGLTTQDFDRLVRVVAEGSGWLKLSGPYRLAKDGNFDRLKPLARALVAAAPSRVIWGSDWPHIPHGQMDTGGLLNLLGDWVPDESVRNAILADNPARLFRA
ncbi:amidohydrolase family protein [Verticiella sediminum]|uniref:Amidohydrolase family protein n=1 Tax=Verticiella sediminum TaxID=1247510 RepID=A0A556B248_9BURK|nr:amidohydrolase family protein [Verticiella sediminum]TSH99249.1 amidohydrolase family protein [Verticiella sediminum]